MTTYTITITADDDSAATTRLRLDTSGDQVILTDLHLHDGNGLSSGQLPTIDYGMLLAAITTSTPTPVSGPTPPPARGQDTTPAPTAVTAKAPARRRARTAAAPKARRGGRGPAAAAAAAAALAPATRPPLRPTRASPGHARQQRRLRRPRRAVPPVAGPHGRTGACLTTSSPSTGRPAAPRPSLGTTRCPGTRPTAGSVGYASRASSPPAAVADFAPPARHRQGALPAGRRPAPRQPCAWPAPVRERCLPVRISA